MNQVTTPTLSVNSAGDLPLNCVLTLKAGSTFLRNVFHVLQTGELYHDPIMIHNWEGQTKRDLTRAELTAQTSFFVVRDPIARFFSLYFDKVISPEPRNFPWVIARLKKNWTFHDGPDLTLEQHRENCLALVWFLKFRFEMHPMEQVNPHWRTQTSVVNPAIKFGMKGLLQSDLSVQLLHIADGRVDGLKAAIDKVGQRNKSTRLISADDILTPRLKNLIFKLYEDDFALYKLLLDGWADGQPPDLSFLVE